jgi:hypothetical protein
VGRNLAPAVVHLAHRRWSTAFGSVGLHLAMTGTGVAIGYAFGIALQPPCDPTMPCKTNAAVPLGPGYGAIVGSMSATVLDSVFFAYRQRLSWTAAAPPPGRTWAFAPYVAPHGAGIAAAGTL